MRSYRRRGRESENAVAEIAGVQTVARAIALVRLVTQGPRIGMTLAEVAAKAGLHRATAHRLLAALAREHLLEQDESHRYHTGIDLWVLGEAAGRRFDIREFGRPALERIAAETQDTAYISVRNGSQAVCVGRSEGAFPIRTLSLSVGDRRPLGVGSGSLVLLAFLPEADREEVFERLGSELGSYPSFSPALIRTLVDETRERGYSFVGGTVLPGMAAVGVPVLDRNGHAIAALSVAAIEPRVTEPRRAQLVAILKAQAALLADRLGLSGLGKGSAARTEREQGSSRHSRDLRHG